MPRCSTRKRLHQHQAQHDFEYLDAEARAILENNKWGVITTPRIRHNFHQPTCMFLPNAGVVLQRDVGCGGYDIQFMHVEHRGVHRHMLGCGEWQPVLGVLPHLPIGHEKELLAVVLYLFQTIRPPDTRRQNFATMRPWPLLI